MGLLLLITQFNARAQDPLFPGECYVTDSVGPGDTSQSTAGRPVLSTTCGRASVVYNSFFKKQSSYIPDSNIWQEAPDVLNTTPETVPKKIKIRFVVVENNDTGLIQKNFRPSDSSDLLTMVSWLNDMMSNLVQPTNPVSDICGSCHIEDERIGVELTGIDFINDPIKYTYPANTYSLTNRGKYQDRILNIYLYVDSSRWRPDKNPDLFTPGGVTYNLGDPLVGPGASTIISIAMFNTYLFAKSYTLVDTNSTFDDNLWEETLRLMHEIHHALGLGHLQLNEQGNSGFDPGGCSGPEFLMDAYPNGCPMSYNDDSTNNIMNTSRVNNTNHWLNYLSPLQVGRVHRNSFLGLVSKYMYPVEDPDIHPWIVDSNETWDFPIRMFQDIVVNSGATLTIKCLVQMPPNGLIVVRKGGKLIIDGGHITSYNALRTWGGIEVEGQPNQISDASYQGSVIIENGAIIERAENGVKNYLTRYCTACRFGDPGGGGGIINASNSWFYNCARAVKLADYPSFNYAPGNCSFVTDSFVWDDPDFAYDTAGMFTTWSIKGGLKIWDCNFKNAISRDSVKHEARGLAIEVESTSAYILQNRFDGFYGGIFNESYNGLPDRNVQVYNNHFNHITANIMYGAGCFGEIKGNDFTNMYGWESGQYDGDIPVNDNDGYAVYLDHSSGTYVGCGNEIYGTTDQVNGNLLARYGVIVNNSGKYGDIVLDNYYYDLTFGIQTQLDNPELTLYCNHHFDNDYAWVINPQTNSSAYSLMDQGNGCGPFDIRAHSTFSGSGVMDIASYLSNSWNYYAWDTVGGQYPSHNIGSVFANNCNEPGTDPNDPCSPSFHTNCAYEIYNPTILDSLLQTYNNLEVSSPLFTLEQKTLFGSIIRAYAQLEDTLGMQEFLEEQHSDEAYRLLIPLYIENGFYDKVAPTIDSLNLSKAEEQGYSDYYSLLSNLKQSGRQIFDLTAAEKSTVEQIAADTLEVSPYAKSLLDFVYGEKWEHPIEAFPDTVTSFRLQEPLDITGKESILGNAVPNPAHNRTSIPVYITSKDAGGYPKLIIYTVTGRQIAVKNLQAGENDIDFNTKAWQPGLYFYSLELKGKVLKTKRLSILK